MPVLWSQQAQRWQLVLLVWPLPVWLELSSPQVSWLPQVWPLQAWLLAWLQVLPLRFWLRVLPLRF